MSGLGAFLAMGGYAPFVWPAYGAALMVLIVLLAWTLGGYRKRQRELEALQRKGERRR
ncbi:MAG TPA: heme exporter protein CcmD [Stellaceae bacterium]|nr:heme exporter protein CcmD [Stellaceae bacterium]